jgi:hypothetical protein
VKSSSTLSTASFSVKSAGPPPLAVRDTSLALMLLMSDHSVAYICVDDARDGEQVLH